MDISSGFFYQPAFKNEVDASSFELIFDPEGGFFQLWRGNSDGRNRAYKVLKPCFRGQMIYEDLLRKEYEIGIRLDHPNIRQYYRYFNNDALGNAIEMEWVNGVPLDSLAHVSRKEMRRLLFELCSALEYLHSIQVVHRDIKPSNLLVTAKGRHLKLIDFGFSDADCYTLLKTPAGTPRYASPELVSGGEVDGRSDVWSLGVVISEFLPHNLGISSKCMRKNPERRFRDASDVAKALKWRERSTFAAAVVLALSLALTANFAVQRHADGEPVAEGQQDTVVVSLDDIFDEATRMMIDADLK